MIPNFNNVYGHVISSRGLDDVLRAVQPLVAEGRAWIYVSGYDGARTLHLQTDSLDFESTPLDTGTHLLNGGVGGTLEEVLAVVEAMSEKLSLAGIEHSFEVYDEARNLLKVVPSPQRIASP